MPRTIADAQLASRASRDRLTPGKKPHWKTLVPGKTHLGYRRRRRDEPGTWLVRHYLGDEKYHVATLGPTTTMTRTYSPSLRRSARRSLIVTIVTPAERRLWPMPSRPTPTR
jgi:hypothetical protein